MKNVNPRTIFTGVIPIFAKGPREPKYHGGVHNATRLDQFIRGSLSFTSSTCPAFNKTPLPAMLA